MANDLIINPDYGFKEKTIYKTLVSAFENGAEQRRVKTSLPLKEYYLPYKNLTNTNKETIMALFETKKGKALTLTWTHPISKSTLTVRFRDDELEPIYTFYGLWDLEVYLISIA